MFKEEMVTTDGVVYKKKVVEVPAEPSSDRKAVDRLLIEQNVFDIHDSVADTTKWLSLLSSMVARMYDAMPEEQKSLIPPDERQVLEYAMSRFTQSTTRADVQFAQEGIAMIDKIFDRQTQLANIVK